MNISDLIFLSFGLAMDAFAVSVSDGMSISRMNFVKASAISLVFGIFQGVMPSMAYFISQSFMDFIPLISLYGNIVACIILSVIGIKMIKDRNNEKDTYTEMSSGLVMVQGMASSIDAMMTGIGFSATDTDIVVSCAVIAFITFVCCLFGCFIGKRFGDRMNGKAQLIGGIMLILIGLKTLF